jgi:organic hydroperoxide reductase OsmC/OhrA
VVSHVDGENLKVDLTMAKALGGKGDAGKTNPEELFAAGYGMFRPFSVPIELA